MYCLLLNYFNNNHLRASSRHTGTLAVGKIGADPTNSLSTQRMTITIAVYTELILLMMSSVPARNM